jgi:hypothetical protein
MDADADEFIWMTCVLSAWRKHGKMLAAVKTYQKYNGKDFYATFEELEKLKSAGHVFVKMHAQAWLALYFQPVSEALWDGADDARAMKIWKKTKREGNKAMQREIAERHKEWRTLRAENQASAAASKAFAGGWLKKHDWGTVK